MTIFRFSFRQLLIYNFSNDKVGNTGINSIFDVAITRVTKVLSANLQYKNLFGASVSTTGCSNWKITKVKGCGSETMHFWPHVVKTKRHLIGGRFFPIFRNLFTFFSCLFAICQINYHISNAFWLYQQRVKYALFLSYSLLIL